MGWRRTSRYVGHRLIRLADSTQSIAGGLALGFTISFSPLVGLHFLQCVLICYLLRFNILASFIGTSVGNPWTYPFIWWASYETGEWLFGLFGWQSGAPLPDHVTLGVLWDLIQTRPMEIFLPWLLGGTLIGILSFFPAYFLFYRLIYAARLARRRARLHKAAREVTGQPE
jgi:uncharacterized protein